jgi:hypothetical protein
MCLDSHTTDIGRGGLSVHFITLRSGKEWTGGKRSSWLPASPVLHTNPDDRRKRDAACRHETVRLQVTISGYGGSYAQGRQLLGIHVGDNLCSLFSLI